MSNRRDLEQAMDLDRDFFARHPQRRYRLRLMQEAEREQQARVSGKYIAPRPDIIDVIAVEQVRPGVRVRSHFSTRAGFDPDLPEEACRRIFFAVTPRRLLKQREFLLKAKDGADGG